MAEPDLTVAPPADRLSSLFDDRDAGASIRLERGSSWRRALGPRRLVAAFAVAPLLLGMYADQVGGLGSLSWVGLAGLLAVTVPAALTVATYVPQSGADAAERSPCAAAAGLTVLFAGMALGGAPLQPATVLLAMGLAGYGLVRRVRGAAACGRPGWY